MLGVVILGDSRVEVREVPKPQVKPGWVLVKTMVSGLCGSDLHAYRSPATTAWLLGKVVGHEPAGIVEEIGDGVTAVQPGDRVSVYHNLGCGHCDWCLSGYRQFCSQRVGIAAAGYGSCAEYVLAPEINCLPLPDELSFVDGAFMACTAGTAFSVLCKLQPSGESDLAVFGLGPVGLSVLLEAKAFGARVIGVEIIPERIALGRQLGADAVVDARSADPVEEIRRFTGGRGITLAVEASGSAAGRQQLVDALGPSGKGVFVGWGSDARVVNPAQLIQGERVLMGSSVLPMGLYRRMAEFLVRRSVRLERMVTHRYSIEQADEAFAVFAGGRTGKVVLEFV